MRAKVTTSSVKTRGGLAEACLVWRGAAVVTSRVARSSRQASHGDADSGQAHKKGGGEGLRPTSQHAFRAPGGGTSRTQPRQSCVPQSWSLSHEISADDGEDHSHAKGLTTGVHPDVISGNVSRHEKKCENQFDAWQDEVLLLQPVHERTQRDKGVVPDGEIVEEVSGLVPPPFHELIYPTTATQLLVLGVVLFPVFAQPLTQCASSALPHHGFAQGPKQQRLAKQKQPRLMNQHARE